MTDFAVDRLVTYNNKIYIYVYIYIYILLHISDVSDLPQTGENILGAQ